MIKKMKKTPIYFVLLCTAAMIAACVQPLDPGVKGQQGKYLLDLSVRCASPATKAPTPGVDTLNENKIATLDWFVFRTAGDDAEAFLHGRETLNENLVGDTTVTKQDMEPYVDAVSKTVSGYVYILANLPATYTHEALAAMTLGDMKKIAIATTLDIRDENGKFKPQDNFVMASGVEPFTLTEDAKQKTVLAPLTRAASKITLNVSIVSAIDEIVAQMSGRDTLAEQYLQTWYPDVENIQIYLSYANRHTTLDRTLYGETPYSYDPTNFFTYNRYGFTPTISTKEGGWSVSGTPFYSYPMTWSVSDAHAPFIKIILPWRPYKETPNYDEHYEYIVHNHDGQTHQGNKLVDASRLHINDKSAPAQEFYYKIGLPLDGNQLTSNTWYDLSLDVAILGGRTDDISIELAGKYYVVDWSTPDFEAGGQFSQGSYLSLATPRDTFYIYGGNSIEIPVKSSHTLAASITSRKAYLNGSWTTTPKTIGTRTVPTNLSTRGTATPNGRTSVTFTDPLNTTMGNTLDCYPMSFTIDIRHADSSSGLATVKTVTVIQYPSIYIDTWLGGNVMVDGYYGRNESNRFASYREGNTPTFGNSSNTSENTSAATPYAPITQYVSSDINKNMIVLSISAFGSDSKNYTVPAPQGGGNARTKEYLIADPRVNANYSASDLIDYFNGSETNPVLTSWGDKAAGVMISDRDTTNYIAPKFLIASRWGRTGNWGNGPERYETAIKRCATYQEAGYPAGRWRLPTEAEIMFMADMQSLGFINKIFSNDGQNISASGSVIRVQDDGTITYWTQTSNTVGSSCRCVYDLWYWGDEPVADPTVYTIGVK